MKIEELYGATSGRRGAHQFDPADPAAQTINPEGLFDGSQLFTQVIVAARGRTVWVSGLIGCDADNHLVGGKVGQIQRAFANLRIALEKAGVGPADCMRVTEYVADYSQADLVPIKACLRELFPPDRLPTNVLVPVTRLGRDGALFEIDAFCVIPD